MRCLRSAPGGGDQKMAECRYCGASDGPAYMHALCVSNSSAFRIAFTGSFSLYFFRFLATEVNYDCRDAVLACIAHSTHLALFGCQTNEKEDSEEFSAATFVSKNFSTTFVFRIQLHFPSHLKSCARFLVLQ